MCADSINRPGVCPHPTEESLPSPWSNRQTEQSKIPVRYKSFWNSADIKQKEDLKPGVPRCSLLFGRYLQINMDKNC